MATITWQIQWMNVKPAEGQYTDVVITAGWICTGTETIDGKEGNGAVYSTCAFSQPEGDFTPYADLTQEQVLGWVWTNGVDKDATEAAVQQQINDQINPPVVTPKLPWIA